MPKSRVALALVLALPALSGCGFFGNILVPRSPEPGPAQSIYRAAMTEFSDCATTSDPATRAVLAGRLAQAAETLQAETRPTDLDHVFIADRVTAAAEYCAAAAR